MIRAEQIERLRRQPFDILVVGGGINGCAIARDAVLRGLRVALVERGDFASGASSRTSKLIHGGFRYLSRGHLGLVHEAVTERDRLRRRLAPNLVRPMPFLFALYRRGGVRPWQIRIGMHLYDLLASFRNVHPHRMLGRGETLSRVMSLKADGLVGAAWFYDCAMDDARLTLTVLRSAADFGLVAANYVRAEGFLLSRGRVQGIAARDEIGGRGFEVGARVVVNASGPWVDEVQNLADGGSQMLRKTKGIHLVLPAEKAPLRSAVVLVHPEDRRMMFAFPWGPVTIVGTTDSDHEGPPADCYATHEEAEYVLAALHHRLPGLGLQLSDVLTTYAGVRPLATDSEGRLDPSDVSREEIIRTLDNGLVTVAGGKFTTHRSVARKVMDRVCAVTRFNARHELRKRSPTADVPLFDSTDLLSGPRNEAIEHLLSRYGSRGEWVLRRMLEAPEEGRPLADGLPYRWAEVDYILDHEMPVTLRDMLQRRIPLAMVSPTAARACATAVARRMGERLGWDEATTRRNVADFEEEIARNQAALRRSSPDATPSPGDSAA